MNAKTRGRLSALTTSLRKFRARTWRERALLLETALTLGATSLAIRVLPFRVLIRLASWPIGREARHTTRDVLLRRVRWAVRATSKRAPWDAVCLYQALTAQIVLRRRGAPSVLYYGVHPGDADGMRAHAWVRCDDYDVVGGEVAADYAVLASFPRAPADNLREVSGT